MVATTARADLVLYCGAERVEQGFIRPIAAWLRILCWKTWLRGREIEQLSSCQTMGRWMDELYDERDQRTKYSGLPPSTRLHQYRGTNMGQGDASAIGKPPTASRVGL